MNIHKFTVDEIRSEFSYDKDTGVLYRNKRDGGRVEVPRTPCYAANRKVPYGCRAQFKETKLLQHHIAWILSYGEHPSADVVIDHVDGNPLNNALLNLRVATACQNSWNRVWSKGCFFDGRRKKTPYSVYIRKNKKRIYVGSFETEEAALLAFENAKKTHHGEFARK